MLYSHIGLSHPLFSATTLTSAMSSSSPKPSWFARLGSVIRRTTRTSLFLNRFRPNSTQSPTYDSESEDRVFAQLKRALFMPSDIEPVNLVDNTADFSKAVNGNANVISPDPLADPTASVRYPWTSESHYITYTY